MAIDWLVGTPCTVQFPLFQADGFTRLEGEAVNVTAELRRTTEGGDGLEDPGLDVIIDELDIQPGEYTAVFTPDIADRTYYLTLRHADSYADYEQTIQVWTGTLSELGIDFVIDVTGIERVVVDEAWPVVVRFRRKSTLAPFDPHEVISLEVLSGDGQTTLETIDGADADHLELGRYKFTPTPFSSAGVKLIRIKFKWVNAGNVFEDVIPVYVLTTDAAESVAPAVSEGLTRIYTCRSALVNTGLDVADLHPDLLNRVVRNVSAYIDEVTNQWFIGEYDEWLFDGNDRRFLEHKSRIPFLGVDSIHVVGKRTTLDDRPIFDSLSLDRNQNEYPYTQGFLTGVTTLDSDDWFVKDRMVACLLRHGFPGGVGNIRITGILGWVEKFRRISTSSTSEVAFGSTSVTVESAADFTARDVVDIIGDSVECRVVLTGVDKVANTLTFDPVGSLSADIPVGATVRTFGQVPRPIEDLANFLVARQLGEREDRLRGSEVIDPARIRREKTDDYEIEFFPPQETITGAAKYDQIIRRYQSPGGVRPV